MNRAWYFRLIVVAGCCGLAAYLLYPSYFFYYRATEEQKATHESFCEALPGWVPCKRFNLGLDLQGGVHLVMGVDVDKAVEQRLDRLADGVRDGLREADLGFSSIERPRNQAQIELQLADGTDGGAVDKLLRQDFSVLEVARRPSDGLLILELIDDEAETVRETAVDQTIKTIRNRADQFGVTEPTIAKRGVDNVLIQLPGVKDPDRAIKNIGKTAQLEFKIVDEAASQVFDEIDPSVLPEGVVRREDQFNGPDGSVREVYFELSEGRKDVLRPILEEKLPSNREVAFGDVEGTAAPGGGPTTLRTYVLNARAGITGDYLTNAQVRQNPDLPSDYYVTMTFDTKGGKIFADLTGENVERRMAIVLDDRVNSAPTIQERIAGGTARITLGGVGNPRKRFEEARDLSLVLKAGALPAPVEVREKRQVGQTLGAESVRRGSMAIGIGAVLVVIFMVLWYRGSGLIANLALVLNVFFVLAVLALFEATLTLPGMAGIVLTIGMAVDANVIIFERIKEELGIGKTPRAAIESGYGKAFSTIFDANVTTLIAGVVLMEYGSGPVRGFAVTLIIGILCSMFTAIVVTRLVFDFFSSRRRLQSLSI